VKTIFQDVSISEDEAEQLAEQLRDLAECAREGCETYYNGQCSGRLEGFVGLATTLGIMPAITRAGNRMRQKAA
jgi:hypothetical protein